MTFQQLTYVVEVSKCGSINKAAHKLFLSQSGISTAVRELEQELGIQFFTRSNRGVEFTPAGKEFLGYAVSLLEQKQRIERLYGEARTTAAPFPCWSKSNGFRSFIKKIAAPQRLHTLMFPASGILLRTMPLSKRCGTPRTALTTSPSRTPAWKTSFPTCMSAGQT